MYMIYKNHKLREEEVEFIELSNLAKKYVENCRNEDDWEFAYHYIFSDAISKKLYSLSKDLNISLDYHDPDTTYEEDVMAFLEEILKIRNQILKINGICC